MRAIKINALIIFLLVMLFGCGQKKIMTQEEYKNFVSSESSELVKSKIFNKINYTCRLQPPELSALVYSSTTFTSQADFESEKKSFDNQLNFVIVIEDEQGGRNLVKRAVFDKESYSSILTYANRELQNDFKLSLADKGELKCSIVHVEPANSIQPVIRIAVSFNIQNIKTEDYTLIFDDNFFNNGKIKFIYDKKILDNLPTLKI
jgi:hypothetical protein